MGASASALLQESIVKHDGKVLKIVDIKIKSGDIPKFVHKLEKDIPVVKEIRATNCQIKKLSNAGGLEFLAILDLSNNKIESIDDELSKNHALEDIFLSHNELAECPFKLLELPKLSLLDLSYNRLAFFPIPSTSLRTLILDANEFSKFPIPICSITSLTTLSFNNNGVSDLPPQVSF